MVDTQYGIAIMDGREVSRPYQMESVLNPVLS